MLVYGEAGIGKSCAFRDVMVGLAARWPANTFLPIYVEYSGESSDYVLPSFLLASSLGMTNPGKASIESCLQTLEAQNRYVLLIADAIDLIYASTANRGTRASVLAELGELGGNPSGRVFVVVCGGASVTPALIDKSLLYEKDRSVVAAYPLLSDATSLNGHKFQTFIVAPAHPPEHDYHAIAKHYRLDEQRAHQLFFMCGTDLRVVDAVCASSDPALGAVDAWSCAQPSSTRTGCCWRASSTAFGFLRPTAIRKRRRTPTTRSGSGRPGGCLETHAGVTHVVVVSCDCVAAP